MEKIEFSLGGHEFIPLCDLLKRVGICESGGVAKTLIATGEVKVNGVVETRKRFKTRSGHVIECHDYLVTVADSNAD